MSLRTETRGFASNEIIQTIHPRRTTSCAAAAVVRLLPVLAALLCALTALPARAAERTLLTLESVPTGTIKVHVLDKPGVQRVTPIAASPRWLLKPGDRLEVKKRPPDRVIELYSGAALAPSLLGRVVLHYYASGDGWAAALRLDDQPAVARVNGRWMPVGGIAGLVRYGNTLPNADGFFPTIVFGSSSAATAIVAWRVR